MKMKYTPEEWNQLNEKEKIEYMESMKHVLTMYSVYDRIAQVYGSIVMSNKGDGNMSRDFFELMNDKNQVKFYNNPGDYELWKIGEFNERTGEIDTSTRTIIINGQAALDYRKKEE